MGEPADIPEFGLTAAELEVFAEQLSAENETVSFLLKAHLFSEYHLERLLAAYLGQKREPLDRVDLRFSQKLSLVDSFALLPQECIRSLRGLNKLRNKCVHTFNTRPSLEDVRRVTSEFRDGIPGAERIETVPELLQAYMAFLCGYFSAASYDLTRAKKL